MSVNKFDELVCDATSLKYSVGALETFLFHRCDNNMSMEDINKLNGLVAAISSLADKHESDMEEYGMK